MAFMIDAIARRYFQGISRSTLSSLLVLMALMTGTALASEGDKRADRKADAWIGRDASELLLQMRVDGGRVNIEEDDEKGETRYTWSTWNPAWTETTTYQGDVIGMTPGAKGGPSTPIFGQGTTVKTHHPATHRCNITFIADMEGIIRSWRYTGSRCANDIDKPKAK
ncbi:hypothetical protein OK348_15295 [Flavobacterium sp. MXW15]|uniref:Uncharacterized protein n=1 Tax=Xanthomonas chitinilytica TaxID=2989819 RepID=A0ABT3JZ38_9XANT|nr:hypothetical protein [Xanthomonas sp. H13-6]MCW4456154.1 hypothetical protein [Flavobacterium sp. MXW15]MCW4473751.1 hypothetical protein [Xanthomonas sp. H13-6]